MSHFSEPWSILSSNVGVGVTTDDWNLAESSDEPFRSFSLEITFATPFFRPPVVHLGLTGFDIDQRDSGRVSLKAENITGEGFRAVITTWADSRVYAVEFQWLAIGA